MPLSACTTPQLEDLRDRLRDPFPPRVFVPYAGGVALLSGQLDEERLRLDETTTTLTRPQAYQRIQDELKTRKQPKISPKDATGTKSAVRTTVDTPPSNAPPPTPQFFEIREEIDESGNQIKSETINMTQQLSMLQVNGDSEEKSDESDDAFVPLVSPPPLQTLSQDQYQDLRGKLERLEEMEKQAAAEQVVNAKSARKLQSSGWSKGFLNSKRKAAKPKEISKLSVTPDTAPKATVSFAADVKPPANSPNQEVSAQSVESTSSISGPTPPPRQPLDTTLFSGTILERPRKSKASLGSSKPKRVSKFAQERQQGLR